MPFIIFTKTALIYSIDDESEIIKFTSFCKNKSKNYFTCNQIKVL